MIQNTTKTQETEDAGSKGPRTVAVADKQSCVTQLYLVCWSKKHEGV